MTDIVAFVKARLAEDQAAAEAAPPSPWRANVDELFAGDGTRLHWAEHAASGMDEDAVVHIVRHDPARVLREVAAKRRLLALDADPDEYNNDVVRGWAEAHYQVCRLLALPYASHPDYDPSWSPS